MPGGQRPHGGHPLVHLLPEQHAAPAGLGPLADDDLDGVGLAEVGRDRSRSATAGPGRRAATRPCAPRASCRRRRWWSRCPTAVAARPRASLAEADSAPKLMPAMVMGMSSSRGSGAVPAAEHGAGLAALAVALERVARDRGGQEDEIVEGRDLPAGAQASDRVAARCRPSRGCGR